MRISSIEMLALNIPFKMGFRHAGAERSVTQTVIVKVFMDNGVMGCGEGCPREYVSGESVASCYRFFDEVRNEIMNLVSLDDLKLWVSENRLQIDLNPSAWSAIEIGLLDAFAKVQMVSLEQLTGLPELSGEFKYSAVLGDMDAESAQSQISRYAGFGFTDYKLKATGDVAKDSERLHMIRETVKGSLSLRIDANNLWEKSAQVITYLKQLDLPLTGIEEPLKAFDYNGMLEISQTCGIPVILDESFLNKGHFEPIARVGKHFIINIRISKMGGILRALEIAALAEEHGIPIIIGAQVGESSILSRAALTVANAHRTNLLFQEGAYGTLLLSEDIADPPLMFGAGGVLRVSELLIKEENGLQLNFRSF